MRRYLVVHSMWLILALFLSFFGGKAVQARLADQRMHAAMTSFRGAPRYRKMMHRCTDAQMSIQNLCS